MSGKEGVIKAIQGLLEKAQETKEIVEKDREKDIAEFQRRIKAGESEKEILKQSSSSLAQDPTKNPISQKKKITMKHIEVHELFKKKRGEFPR